MTYEKVGKPITANLILTNVDLRLYIVFLGVILL